jgi:hypothetical protein
LSPAVVEVVVVEELVAVLVAVQVGLEQAQDFQ